MILWLFWSSGLFAQNDTESRILQSITQVTVKHENKVIVKEYQEVLIVRKADAYLGYNMLRETDFVELIDMKAAIYDMSGKVRKELKDKDIQKSSVSYTSLYSEHNTISYILSDPVVPYIVKKEKIYVLKSLFFMPNWDPQEDVPLDYAQLEIILEQPVVLKYLNIGYINDPNITTDANGHKRYKWEIQNISGYSGEYKSAPESRFQIGVKCMPIQFSLDGFKGQAESWQDFGTWYYNLIKDQINFSPDINIGEPFKSISDKKERIRKIYGRLQEKTRYVQIYLGIDGWKPHHVDQIHQAKYGDCKDLSVYMLAMLKQADIEGYPALVLTRDQGDVDRDFPSNNFNHMIAVALMPDDTLYLECTSKVTPVDDLHADIEGVNILLVKPEQSTLITTPVSTADMNKSVFKATARIQPDRSLNIEGKVILTGNQAIDARGILKSMASEERKKWMKNRLSHKSGDVRINSLVIDSLDNNDSNLLINFEANLQYFAKKAGNRLIIEPCLYHKIDFKGENPEDRKMPLLNSTSFLNMDSIQFIFPMEYKVKNELNTDSITSAFGSYSMELSIQDNGALWTSKFVLGNRYVSLDKYSGYYEFMEACKQKSLCKLVLSK